MPEEILAPEEPEKEPAEGVETKDAVEQEPETKADDTVRIALDAMGGDNAPTAIVEGAIAAIANHNRLHVVLVGDEELIKKELEGHSYNSSAISIRAASEVIGMEESPSVALRKKKDSSIHVGVKMVKEKEADVFVSAGHTGAVMAVSAVMLRTMEGIDRAAIAATVPTASGHSVIIDAGANVVCKGTNLYQFGVMGSCYAQYVLGDETPRVGLLSIGEEDSKGTDVMRQAFELLTKGKSVNFIGNVEAKLLYKGVAEVVVCDGFTGNIALKVSESVAGMITGFLKEMLTSGIKGKIAGLLLKSDLTKMKKKIDHSEVGGAPLLGVNGAVIISHGSSDAKSIMSALGGAMRFIDQDVNGHIKESLSDTPTDPLEDSGFWERMKSKIGLTQTEDGDPI